MSIDVNSLTMRETAHYNGGKVFFAYGYTCVQQPRLTLLKRYDRKTKQVTATWRVDAVDQPSLESAIQVLEGAVA